MKKQFLVLLVVIFSFGKAQSQDVVCLDYKLYNADYDVIETNDSSSKDSASFKTSTTSNSMSLTVFQDSLVEFSKRSLYSRHGLTAGYKVVLTNSSINEVSLSNMDGKITIVRQALYKNKWKNVISFNKTPRQICGNSFMSKRTINAYSSLIFVVPCLDGNIETTFRLVVYQKNRTVIYSNEFQGFISRELLE
jgi:hypothetical protein